MDPNKKPGKRRLTRKDNGPPPEDWSAEANRQLNAAGRTPQNTSRGGSSGPQHGNPAPPAPQEGAAGSARAPSGSDAPESYAGSRTRFPNLGSLAHGSAPSMPSNAGPSHSHHPPTRAGQLLPTPRGRIQGRYEDDGTGLINFLHPVPGSRYMSFPTFMANLIVNEQDREARVREARQRAEAERRFIESLPPAPPRGSLRPLRPPPPPPNRPSPVVPSTTVMMQPGNSGGSSPAQLYGSQSPAGPSPITSTSPSTSQRDSQSCPQNSFPGTPVTPLSPSSSDPNLLGRIRRTQVRSRSSSDEYPYRRSPQDANLSTSDKGKGRAADSSITRKGAVHLSEPARARAGSSGSSSLGKKLNLVVRGKDKRHENRVSGQHRGERVTFNGLEGTTEDERMGIPAVGPPARVREPRRPSPNPLTMHPIQEPDGESEPPASPAVQDSLTGQDNGGLDSINEDPEEDEQQREERQEQERRDEEGIARSFSGVQAAGRVLEQMREDSPEREDSPQRGPSSCKKK